MQLLTNAANDFIRIFFEPPCPGCRTLLATPLAGPVCDACWTSIAPVTPPFCMRCGDVLEGPDLIDALQNECDRCRRHPPAFSIARSAGRYEGPLREVLHAFKYERRRQLALPLARLMRNSGCQLLQLNDADAVVPVPLHLWRSIRRGFNQADDLARYLRRPVWRVLRRRGHGPSQTNLSGTARRRNLRSEFVVRRHRTRLRGATVVLIDDVMTTGATLDACARVLLDAGVREVRALTAARTVSGRRPQLSGPPRPSILPR